MTCYHPLSAWRGGKQKSGKRAIVFRRSESELASGVQLPCGQCVGCRLERSRQWAIRCVHESEMYARNCFLTLTFDPEHLPKDGSIAVRDLQLFLKRLRKAYPDDRIRFFACGEYGGLLGRPHYHACLFNFDFADKVLFTMSRGHRLYRSDSLDRIWKNGSALIGEVTFESAAYVARYIMKKINGDIQDEHYKGKVPEFVTMSRGGRGGLGGIGVPWLDKFMTDVFPCDEVVVRGVKMRPPKFYFDKFSEIDPLAAGEIKKGRVIEALRNWRDNDSFRLPVKELVKKSSLKSLRRNLEEVL